MTTAEAIDGISDAGNFEILGVRALRELDPDCKLLEHLGVNAAGKTRKNPIDAFTEVPGSIPPTYVMAQFATSAVEDLEEKWLFDHSVANARAKAKGKVPKKVESDDGDLLKAARAAEGIRQAAPTAAFKLWLCSNRVVDPDLRTKVSNVARARGITVEFLTQTGLRDFLDTTSEGHWLRKLHLGIAAKLLSKRHLQELGRASVDSYAADIAATYQTKFVPTSNLDSLGRTISQRGSTLIFVAGPSGSGKSVLVCQRLRACDAAGGCVLKISERLVEQSDSLAEALEKALVNLSPDLESGCGRAALEIARQSEFTIAVDDINRAASPLRLVEKLVAWTAKPSSSAGTSQDTTAPMVTVLCPIWESVWKAVYKRYANEPRIAQYQVQRMMKTEAVALLRATLAASAANVHDYQLEEVADRLAFDPILLAIFAVGAAARDAVAPTGATTASAVIAQYEEECFEALELGRSIAKSEFRASVSRVSEIMLRERNFYPRWEFLTAEMANEPQLLNHDEDMLLPSLWSILRCAKTDYEDTLRGLIERWAKLPDPGHRGYGFTERQAATQTVRFFCRKGLRPEMIRFLVAHGQSIPIAGEILASALSEVDQPEAITLALQNGIVSDEWNLIMPNARHLSDASRAALRKHWEDSSQDSESRRRAFRLWLNSTTDSKEFLGLVLPDDAWLGSLLWRRCVLRDVSAATDLAARIHQDPFRLHVAHHIWCPVVAQAVDAFMGVVATRFAAKAGGDNDDHTYHLAELLRDIPVAESEPLLLKHWHGLSSVPKFIQAALYIGTPELLARADAAIELHADKTEALVHVGIFFGFIMRGLSERVTSNHIRTLVHYREILPDSEIRHVTSHCLATESMRTHLPSLRKVVEKRAEHAPAGSPASENRRRLFPTEAELFAEFDQAAASQFPGWLDRFDTRIESKEALWEVLQKWAMADLANRYSEFARAAMLCATRSELPWLTRISLEQLDQNQRREREDALYAVRMRSLN